VDRLRPDGPGAFFDPDRVQGWVGAICSGPKGPRSGGDDYLVLAGDRAVEYGIWAGDEAIQVQLESLRDSGTLVRVWGELIAGIPDWNGTQIQVSRIEVVEDAAGAVPAAPQ
jgi:hypothetical protein